MRAGLRPNLMGAGSLFGCPRRSLGSGVCVIGHLGGANFPPIKSKGNQFLGTLELMAAFAKAPALAIAK